MPAFGSRNVEKVAWKKKSNAEITHSRGANIVSII
jgi:hypothetical protein